ncbi:MAG: class D beta-lactamase [Eubacterium sp.]|nr:class D beta-lactamase [Eubacterium sp.]
MKYRKALVRAASVGIAWMLLCCGCAGKRNAAQEQEIQSQETVNQQPNAQRKDVQENVQPSPEMLEEDWSAYFDGLSGAAVLYDASAMQYRIYHKKLALTRRPPCSTFKIISALIALEYGILDPAHSTRTWSGEEFWNAAWNQDLTFDKAFRESCVWYFRQVADEIGQELMQKELDRLMYGNCDISDWEGRLNTNNQNRALTGFWLESSLAVSPKEQAEAMERIFGANSVYKEKTRQELKKVMQVEQAYTDATIYGKTGTGMAGGIVVDAWFTGFAEKAGRQVFFCIYLGQTDGKEVTSAAAKEIAVRLVGDLL